AAYRSAAALRLPATCHERSSAFGVGPLPSSDRRFLPPVPFGGPFFLPLPADGLPGLAIVHTPMRAIGTVLEQDAGCCDGIADAVGARPILVRPRLGALRDETLHERVQRAGLGSPGVRPAPLRVLRVET